MSFRFTLLFTCAALIVLCIGGLESLSNNLTWLAIQSDFAGAEREPDTVQAARSTLHISNKISPSNQRVNLNIGILDAIEGLESDALSHWQKVPVHSNLLIALGQKLEAQGKLDEALIFYQGVIRNEHIFPGEGWYRVGRVCQRTLAAPWQLTRAHQTLCNELWEMNGNNLLLNGDFTDANILGWSTHAGDAAFDDSVGIPAPSMVLSSVEPLRGQGFYQMVALPTDTEVKFSVWVKLDCSAPLEYRLLYIERTLPDGRVGGNAWKNEEQISLCNWTYVERIFQLSESKDQLYRFAPVLLDSPGRIWMDKARLVRVNAEE